MVAAKHRKNGTDVNQKQRVALAIKLRASGMPYAEVAEQAGYGAAGTAYKAIHAELKENLLANVEELRHEEGISLKMLYKECWDLAMDHEYKARLFAVDRCITLSERYSKLMGLDIRSDEMRVSQNYTKEIILVSGEEDEDDSTDSEA